LLNLVTEIPEGHKIDDAELKAIVSGEMTTVENKNKPPFEIHPFCTCVFGTNHMPYTRDFSDALFRRAIVIPFNRVFTDREQDKGLKYKLKAELPGILNLVLVALGDLLKRGYFTETASTEEAKKMWRLNADQVRQFVEECCEIGPEYEVSSSRLYEAYGNWFRENGLKHNIGRNNFTSRLENIDSNICKKRGAGGIRMIAGLKLNTNFFIEYDLPAPISYKGYQPEQVQSADEISKEMGFQM
jgi:putative DNA primase/helicase